MKKSVSVAIFLNLSPLCAVAHPGHEPSNFWADIGHFLAQPSHLLPGVIAVAVAGWLVLYRRGRRK